MLDQISFYRNFISATISSDIPAIHLIFLNL